jgi:hypothetical protein
MDGMVESGLVFCTCARGDGRLDPRRAGMFAVRWVWVLVVQVRRSLGCAIRRLDEAVVVLGSVLEEAACGWRW